MRVEPSAEVIPSHQQSSLVIPSHVSHPSHPVHPCHLQSSLLIPSLVSHPSHPLSSLVMLVIPVIPVISSHPFSSLVFLVIPVIPVISGHPQSCYLCLVIPSYPNHPQSCQSSLVIPVIRSHPQSFFPSHLWTIVFLSVMQQERNSSVIYVKKVLLYLQQHLIKQKTLIKSCKRSTIMLFNEKERRQCQHTWRHNLAE